MATKTNVSIKRGQSERVRFAEREKRRVKPNYLVVIVIVIVVIVQSL